MSKIFSKRIKIFTLALFVLLGGIFAYNIFAAVTVVSIDSPIAGTPISIQSGASLPVQFDVTTNATGLGKIRIEVYKGGTSIGDTGTYDYDFSVNGANENITANVSISESAAEGTYDIKVSAQQPGGSGDWFNDIEVNAVRVDNTSPTVAVTSTTGDGSYKADDTINVTLTFNENVTSSHTLTVTLETGETDRTCTTAGIIDGTDTATCTYTVQAGDTSADLSVSSIVVDSGGTITDAAGNSANLTPTSNIDDTSDIVIDTTAPADFTTGLVTVTGGTVITGYWNSTNTGVDVVVPLADDSSLIGGSIQLQAKRGEGAFANIGDAASISTINTTQTVSITAEQLEGLDGFIDTDVISFTAVISDKAGNTKTGTTSETTFTIKQALPTVAVTSTTGDGSYNADDTINVTLTFNENVTSSNTLTVTLETGDTDGTCTTAGIIDGTDTATCT